MSTHVEAYLRGSETADVPMMMSALAPDAEMISPLVGGAVFRGHEDLRALFTAVYSTLNGLTWQEHHQDGPIHTVLGKARVLGVELTDATIIETDDAGLICTLRPHLRPWSGLTVFALAMGPHLMRQPGLLKRSKQH